MKTIWKKSLSAGKIGRTDVANARKNFWLKQGRDSNLRPLSLLNRIKSVEKSYIQSELCALTKKKEKKTSRCNSRALSSCEQRRLKTHNAFRWRFYL